MKQGDLVVRKSYGGDVVFKIQEMSYQRALLRGVDIRLLADSPVQDLVMANAEIVELHERQMQQKMSDSAGQFTRERMQRMNLATPAKSSRKQRNNGYPYFEVPGKVLHLDGDPTYLRKSMALYEELRVPAEGVYVPEVNMADAVHRLLPHIRPDILVITGHDGILKHRRDGDVYSLSSYKNSQNFVNAVKAARQFDRNRDSLIIVAGACQSHFEALLQAGANFASSPARVLIHALDPLYIAARVSFTSVKETVQITDVIHHTMSGLDGLGGIETKGSFRFGLPKTKSE